MRFHKLLTSVKKVFKDKRKFDGGSPEIMYPHCVIGEIKRQENMDSFGNSEYDKPGVMFTKAELRALWDDVSYPTAMKILTVAIARCKRKGS